MQLRDIYQSTIVDNALNQQHQKPLTEPDVLRKTLFNSSCGDRITVSGKISQHKLNQISFKATGCIISRASANMMGNLCIKQDLSKIDSLVTDFSKLMTGEPIKNPKSLGEAQALQSISELPTRIKCAMLPWKAIYQLINQNEVK
ncbi:Fe-S cluster assembly sulfur transfer protein SufU [Acetilactobacillus jinshanensis]|uniref:SUF system NifU family Fe-S cluster assembly protein n=1 Tax=Acetilactobacillus jinshanensis TaxID=1720083 RepID=A0A4P6ZL01_9LACO|nr:SUF system NifU family Fe-S cluster assembly protein [Acetilactobacillus jinshanensis]QBP18102.1 SUF system NifU family Fe-S cluster assembly protein [Acetilactobacillus jinshanensis]URL60965.1 SUF system NifU family Fe-S cluster assembly protein [uncultured bacterium]